MRHLFLPPPRRPQRVVEASPQQLVATGALSGARDPLDNDGAWRPVGTAGRPVPEWTHERARMHSVASYRCNPMATAIIDTYTAFCVGDSGVKPLCSNPKVEAIVTQWWEDPRNRLGSLQELLLRSNLLNGETALEMMEGQYTGVTRFAPIDPSIVFDVLNYHNNPLWPDKIMYRRSGDGQDRYLKVCSVDEQTGLRAGQVQWWTPGKTLDTDTRGMPFLMPVLDWLDNYDRVLSNLMDRTALARYFVWDVTVDGDQTAVNKFLADRGGAHVPPSGGVEVHNNQVKWEAKVADTGAYEDSNAAKSVLTLVAAGTGLAKTWLAEPEDANRATSLTMAEPVRRRVGGVQGRWLFDMTEFARFNVDRAVAAGRLPRTVTSYNAKTRQQVEVPTAQTVRITGPEIAAADAQLNAAVLLNLATGLEKLVASESLSPEAAQVAGQKAWEDYMRVPWVPELGKPDADVDDIATHIDDPKSRLTAV